MEEFLKRLKVLNNFSVNLNISRPEFLVRFSTIVDRGDTSFLFSSFDALDSTSSVYKGKVTNDGFKIRRRKKVLRSDWGMAMATGTFVERENKLGINVEVNSFNAAFIPFYVIGFIGYGFAFAFLTTSESWEEFGILPFVFLTIHAFAMLGMPYLMMRRGTAQMEYDLTREFHSLAANDDLAPK